MANTITFTVAGNAVSILYGSWQLQRQIDQQDSCKFTIVDTSGTASYSKGQPVVISDSVLGTIWKGFVNRAKAVPLPPTSTQTWQIDCVDNTYLLNKRTSNKLYANQYAGTIVADLIQRYGAAEGVSGAFALDWDELQTDFAAGTLNNTVATTNMHDGNVGDGDLELALAGSDVEYDDGGFLTSSTNALQFIGTAIQGVNNNYVYQKIWEGSITIQSGDHLDYDLWINSTSPQIMAGVDFVCTDGTTFRDSSGAGTDAQGVLPHPKYDLSGLADDQWYHRSFGVSSPLIGKTIQYVSVAFEGDSAGTYTAYFKNISYWKGGGSNEQVIYNTAMSAPSLNNLISNNGYQNVTLKVMLTYDRTAYLIQTHSLSAVHIVKGSYITWVTGTAGGNTGVSPGASTLTETSIDNGATWQVATLNAPIPNLTPGMVVTGRSLQYKITVTLGKDPTIANYFVGVTVKVYTSYNATKSDVVSTSTTQADFNAGTKTNVMAVSGGSLTLNGYARNYDDAFYGNQTLFGNSGPFHGIYLKQLILKADASSEARSRMDYAGNNWSNFTAEVDINVDVNRNLGIEYFTGNSNWNNTLNSYGYNAFVTTTAVTLATGGNGSNAFNIVGTPASASFATNSWHRLKLVVSGNNHKIYVDDVKYIDVNDSTYSGPSYVALRFYNASGTNGVAGGFDNFGIVSNLTGNWQSTNIDISGAGTYGGSVVEWDGDQTPNSTSITVQTSTNGGTTWTTINNGDPISGLTAGSSLSGSHVKLKVILTANNAPILPILNGITVWVMGQFSATGNRISPVLSLANVGRAGSTLVNWNTVTVTNTSVLVDTSLDGSTWTNVSTPGGAIAGITVQPSPTVDSFTSNTSANYTAVGGSTAASFVPRVFGGTLIVPSNWTWDSSNSRLVAQGGSPTMLLVTALSSVGDVDFFVDMDEADAGGVVFHYQGASSFYAVIIGDSAATSTSANQIKLTKVVAGSPTTLGSPATVNFPHNTPHRIRITMLGNTITVYFDGAQIIQTTDSSSPFGAGKIGVRNAGNTSRFYQLYIQPQGDDVTSLSVYTRTRLSSTDPTVTPALLDLQCFVSGPSIGPGVLIPSANYQDTYLSNNIADLNRQSDYWWEVDLNKNIIFQTRAAQPAPWILASSNASTQIGSQSIGDVLVDNLTLEHSGDFYRNRQILKNVQTTGQYTKTFTGDGQVTSWSLDYPVAKGTIPVITLTTFTVNNQAQSIGVQGVDTGKDFYYQLGSTAIQQDSSGTVLAATDSLTISYTGAYPSDHVENNTGQTRYAGTVSQAAMAAIDGSSGIVENVEDVSNLNLNIAAATTYAQQKLKRYGVIGQTVTNKTLRQGLQPGQQVPVFISQIGVTDVQFLVQSVSITATEGQDASGAASILYWYDVVAVTGPALGNWIRLFAGLKK